MILGLGDALDQAPTVVRLDLQQGDVGVATLSKPSSSAGQGVFSCPMAPLMATICGSESSSGGAAAACAATISWRATAIACVASASCRSS
jgi:hypothetical protein